MFDKLREARKIQNLTCQQISNLLGLKTRSAYQKKEQGRVPFRLEEAKKIADFLGTKVEDIFFNDETKATEKAPQTEPERPKDNTQAFRFYHKKLSNSKY